MPVGAVVLVVVGAALCLLALFPAIGGGFLLWAHATDRDADGYFTTATERFETTTYAIRSDEVDLGGKPDAENRVADLGALARVRLRVESTGPRPVFVGIARRADVDRYLRGVASAEVNRVRFDPFSVDYRYQDGGGRRRHPAGPTSGWPRRRGPARRRWSGISSRASGPWS